MQIEITDDATLSTEHAASSCGRPVLVVAGQAYGPADTVTFKFAPSAFFGDAQPSEQIINAAEFVRRYLPSEGDKDYMDATPDQMARINADRRELRAAILNFLG